MFNSKTKIKMVKVIGYQQRETDDGREFFTLTVQGGVEVVTSNNGNLYMTARRTSIPSTFDEEGCQMLVGQDIPGEVVKVNCEPYEYVSKATGEMVSLSHKYEYRDEVKTQNLPNEPDDLGLMPYDTLGITNPSLKG
jgi:hypothetical protein